MTKEESINLSKITDCLIENRSEPTVMHMQAHEVLKITRKAKAMELDPSKPIAITGLPQAQCRVLGMIDALFPLIVAVREYPDARETLYKVDPTDGAGMSAFFRETDARNGVFNFVNVEK